MSSSAALQKILRPRESLRLAGITAAICFGVGLLLFAVFDTYPNLWPASWPSLPEMSQRRDFVVDPDLVFRRRAGYREQSSYGDSFHEIYREEGADPQPIHFEETIDDGGFNAEAVGGDGPTDIALIGDSFVELATSPEDAFGARLQKQLDVSVASYGASGLGPLQYAQVLRRVIPRRDPKLALICVFEGDDLAQTRAYLHWKNGESYQQFRLHPDSGFWTRFGYAIDDAIGLFVRREFLREDGVSTPQELVTVRAGGNAWLESFRHLPDPRTWRSILADEDGRGVARAFDQIHNTAEVDHVPTAIVFIPTAAHLYAPLSDENSTAAWHKEFEHYRLNAVNVELAFRELANGAHLPLINLTPAFEKAAREGQQLYYPFDSHWNSAGRELAAREVARQVGALPGTGVKLFRARASGNRI